VAYDPQAIKLRNEERRFSPIPGDVWDERFCIVMVVLKVTSEYVTVCKEKTRVHDGWFWDFHKTEVWTRQQFALWPTYAGASGRQPMAPLDEKCWCDVSALPNPRVLADWAAYLADGGREPKYTPHTPVRDNYR
jgi:hypothetical protein